MPRTHKISVERSVAFKLKAPARKKLARCGVHVQVRRVTTRSKVLKKGGPTTWRTIEHFFLVYSLLKEVGVWTTIRHILKQSGLSKKEIQKLGLYRLVSQVRRKMKRTRKKTKKTKKSSKTGA